LAYPAIDYMCIFKRKSNKKTMKNLYIDFYTNPEMQITIYVTDLSMKFSVSFLVVCCNFECNSMITGRAFQINGIITTFGPNNNC
jgi:hypothetical protein